MADALGTTASAQRQMPGTCVRIVGFSPGPERASVGTQLNNGALARPWC